MDEYRSIQGKTYSLFGDQTATQPFFDKVTAVIENLQHTYSFSEWQLLEYIQSVSKNKRNLRRNRQENGSGSRLSGILCTLHDSLKENVPGIEGHLKTTPLYKIITDKSLLSSREQYYLYMIEFELVNRIHITDFLRTNYRIALLPYCLRETQEDCRAKVDRVDYQCRGCIKSCYINRVSTLLKEHQIESYIWGRAKLKPLFRNLAKEHGRIGVLGIACIVELVAGMRRCMKAHLPVVGIPLNANRCIRWTDGFYENSIDLKVLEELLQRG